MDTHKCHVTCRPRPDRQGRSWPCWNSSLAPGVKRKSRAEVVQAVFTLAGLEPRLLPVQPKDKVALPKADASSCFLPTIALSW